MIVTLLFLLPQSRIKNFLLKIAGVNIRSSATVRPILVIGTKDIVIGENASIGALCMVRDLESFHIGAYCFIGKLNYFSSYREVARNVTGGWFRMSDHSKVLSRHYFDCSGGVSIGRMSSVAGHESKFLTHSTDLKRNVVTAYPITIGDYCFVGAYSVLLGGAELPSKSILAAGSLMTRAKNQNLPAGLWTGRPARFLKPYDGAWFTRSAMHSNVAVSNEIKKPHGSYHA
jgi:acetyltransferase-like isoleucine patch superfamily enzyme